MKKVLFLVLVCSVSFVQAQYISSVTYPDTITPPIIDPHNISYSLAESITAEDLKKHLSILASDEYEGRETGQPGNDMAATYIKKHFQEIGLEPVDSSYYQDVMFSWESWNNIEMSVGAVKYKHLWDFLAFQDRNKNKGSIEVDEVYFLGYGIDDENYSDFKKMKNKLKGKSIIIYEGEPLDRNGNSIITGSTQPSEWNENIEKKLEAAAKYDVENVFIIANNIKKMLADNRRVLLGAKVNLDLEEDRPQYPTNIIINTTIAKEILGSKLKKVIRAREKITKRKKPKSVRIQTDISLLLDKNTNVLTGQNVMALVEGTDLKDEVIILSAHYDHLGIRGESIYNGADDNGSGTTALLEVAEAYAEGLKQGKRPRRSVLILLVTGEEKGLLGSGYYAENPILPLENTVVDINVDMVGRVDDKYSDNPNYVYVIGSDRLSSELHTINEEVNQNYEQLILDYTYNDEADPNRYYYRSDHYNFAKNGIPAIFFFNGTHEDYHKVTDTVDKIEFDKMAKITKHVFHLSWELANRDKRIIVDQEKK